MLIVADDQDFLKSDINLVKVYSQYQYRTKNTGYNIKNLEYISKSQEPSHSSRVAASFPHGPACPKTAKHEVFPD